MTGTSDGLDTRPSGTPNVILTGFMGTGKTTVGRLLADRLAFEFVDTDVVIEERHGPISTIFAQWGETAFRQFERELAGELGQRHSLVVSTGGRMLLDPDNAAALGTTGRIFCLVASAEEIHRRVVGDGSPIERPLLAVDDPAARIIELLNERRAAYNRFTQVETDGRTPEMVAEAVLALIGES